MSAINSGIFGSTGMGLNNAFGIAESGMLAAQAQMNVAANNIANLNTSGFQSQRVDLVQLSSNGVGDGVAVSGISTDTTPSSPAPSGSEGNGDSTQPSSNVDLAGQIVGLKQAQVLYDANAMVVKVANQMVGTLIDVMDDSDNSDHSNNSNN